jgi:hypothetical protein
MVDGTQGLRKERSNVYIMHMQSVQSAYRVSDLQEQCASTQSGVQRTVSGLKNDFLTVIDIQQIICMGVSKDSGPRI